MFRGGVADAMILRSAWCMRGPFFEAGANHMAGDSRACAGPGPEPRTAFGPIRTKLKRF